jgi:restriction system protein
MKRTRGPEFIRFLRPVLEVLIESGGSGTASEIVDRSLELTKVSESEQEAVNKNGQSRVKNQVHWARQYLVWDGYLDSSKRGVWSLTDKGKSVNLNTFNTLDLHAVRLTTACSPPAVLTERERTWATGERRS